MPVGNNDIRSGIKEQGYNELGISSISSPPTVLDNDTGTTLIVSKVGTATADTTISSTSPKLITGIYGTLSMNQDGTYTYTLHDNDSDTQQLNSGDNVTEVFTYEVTDTSDNSTDIATLTLNIDGTNDAPIAVDDSSYNYVETQVNTYTNLDQRYPSITALNDGGYVLSWSSDGQDSSDYGIYLQRYDVNGNTVGSETRVNTYTNSDQMNPSITALNDGGYVLSWESYGQDGSSDGIYLQRYDSNGVAVGLETQVNTHTDSAQRYSSITALNDGGYVVSWSSKGQDGDGYGVYLQRYDSNGVAVGSETQVNSYTNNDQMNPSITALNDGGYVLSWESYGQDGSSDGIYLQRYDSNGVAVGTETQVNTYTDDDQRYSSITALNDGGYILSWNSREQDGSDYGIYLQRYDSNGNKISQIATQENTPLTIDVLSNDSDVDIPSTLSINSFDTTTTGGGTVSLNGTGDKLIFDPGSDFDHLAAGESTTVTFTYDVINNNGAISNTATVSVTITGNSAPIAVNDGLVETQVNTYTTNSQSDPSITTLNDGGYIVSWTSYGQDGSSDGIYLQRYDSNGNAVGTETQVNTYTDSSQEDPSITALNDGGYVLSWESYGQDSSSNGIYLQRYDSNGVAVGTETRVNTYTNSHQRDPSITALNDGGYVLSWESNGQDGNKYGIYLQRYDVDGNAVGSEIQVNTYTDSYQTDSSITALNDGGYVLSWESKGQDSNGYEIYLQRYDVNGNAVNTEETRVNTYITNNQSDPSITALNDGGYVLSWESDGQDNSDDGIYLQRYDVDGNAVGSEAQVNTYIASDQKNSSITALNDGGYVLSWESYGQDGSGYGIYLQRYDVNGNAVGSETQVNTYTDNNQTDPSITALNDGGYVVSWGSLGQDGSDYGIYLQRYDANGNKTSQIITQENTPLTIDVLSNDTDVDIPSTLSINSFDTITTGGGTVSLNGTGDKLIFDPGSDFDHLAVGESTTVTFTYDVIDNNGAISNTATVSVTVTGTNDAPIITSDISQELGVVTESGHLDDGTIVTGVPNAAGTLTVSDIDNGATQTWSVEGVNSNTYGTFTLINPNSGEWTYTLDNTKATTQALKEGDSVDEVFTLRVTDDQGAYVDKTVTVTINGTNDAPIAVDDSLNNYVETQVNTYTDNNQNHPSITALNDGGYVLSWESYGQDGSGYGIYLQRYDSNGVVVGTETRVNTYTNLNQRNSSITALHDGGYILSWHSKGQDSSDNGIYLQRYDSNGIAVGTETQVNTHTTNSQRYPSITALHDGGYVLSWESDGQDSSDYGIYLQRYDFNGNAIGTETQVNTYTNLDQRNSSITALNDGGYVLSWSSDEQDSNGSEIYLQRYDFNGNAVGTETQVNTYTNLDQSHPSITTLNDDGYVVSWSSYGQDSNGSGIYLQRYDSNGNVVGTETQVNTHTIGNQSYPSITALSDGGYVLSWSSYGQDSSDNGIYLQRYDSNGNAVGTETQVNTYTDGSQMSSSITALNDGGYIVSWSSLGQDGSGNGIYLQRYDVNGNPNSQITTQENTPLTIDVLSNDTDVDIPSTLSINSFDTTTTGGGTVSLNGTGDKLIFDPGNDFDYLAVGESTIVTFTYDVIDNNGAISNTATVSVVVEGINNTSILVSNKTITATVIEAGNLDDGTIVTGIPDATGVLIASDPDSSTTRTWVVDSVYGTFELIDAKWTYTLDNTKATTQSLKEGDITDEIFTVLVTDDTGAYVNTTIVVTIVGTNDKPIVVADNTTISENETTTINVLANDSDVDNGDVLTLESVSVPSGMGSVSIVDNEMVFDPGSDFEYLNAGESTVVVAEYSVHDSQGAVEISTVTITVIGISDGPLAMPDTASGTENEILDIDLLANDVDSDEGATHTLDHVEIVSGMGSVSIIDNKLHFDPGTFYDSLAVGENAEVIVNYTMSNDNGESSSSVVAITLTGTNDAPVIADDLLSTFKNILFSNTHDIDGDIVTVNSIDIVETTKLIVDEDTGYFQLIPAHGFADKTSFTYRVSDGNGGTDTATVDISGDSSSVISGTDADDRAFGTSGDNIIVTFDGNDRIEAGAGDDIISAGDGADYVVAGDGDDTLIGGKGFDVLVGEVGDDSYLFNLGDSTEGDVIWSEGGDTGDNTIIFGEGIEKEDIAFYFDESSGHVMIQYSDSDTIDLAGDDYPIKFDGNDVGISEIKLSDGSILTGDKLEEILIAISIHSEISDVASVRENSDIMDNIIVGAWV